MLIQLETVIFFTIVFRELSLVCYLKTIVFAKIFTATECLIKTLTFLMIK